jgi:hypothetical protein
MFSTTIKRSVATLGVVGGLLAAAVPASAQPAGTAPPLHNDALTVKAAIPVDELIEPDLAVDLTTELTPDLLHGRIVKAPASLAGIQSEVEPVELRGTQVGSEGVTDNVPLEQVPFNKGAASGRPQGVIWDLLEQANAGTQVGSEGVMNGNDGDDTLIVGADAGSGDDRGQSARIDVVADAGSGNDNLRGEAIDIIP